MKLLPLLAFSRPHTMLGTLVSVPSVALYSGGTLSQAATALPSALLANLYIVGLNQLADVEVDRTNKPNLPLAEGSMTTQDANTVVGVSGLVALLSAAHSWPVLASVSASMLLGTLYSHPRTRWRRSPVLAALCIVLVRGVIVQSGFAWHVGCTSLQLGPMLFFSAFALVIAIVKDVADTKGDKAHNLGSLAICVGRRATLDIAGVILQLTLSFGILVASNRKQLPIVLAAVYVSTRLILENKYTDITDNDQVSRLYQMYWRCFYISYLALPFLR